VKTALEKRGKRIL